MFNKNLHIFIILTTFIKSIVVYQDKQIEEQEISDITKDLTDKELEFALSDLSLKDLNTLQQFIDSADYDDFNYNEKSLIESNFPIFSSYDFENQEVFNNMMEFYPQDNTNYQPLNPINNLEYIQNPVKSFFKYSNENIRSKRGDNRIKIKEEYIKKLDFSFPQTMEQNSYIDTELKKNHIRVKRN